MHGSCWSGLENVTQENVTQENITLAGGGYTAYYTAYITLHITWCDWQLSHSRGSDKLQSMWWCFFGSAAMPLWFGVPMYSACSFIVCTRVLTCVYLCAQMCVLVCVLVCTRAHMCVLVCSHVYCVYSCAHISNSRLMFWILSATRSLWATAMSVGCCSV